MALVCVHTTYYQTIQVHEMHAVVSIIQAYNLQQGGNLVGSGVIQRDYAVAEHNLA